MQSIYHLENQRQILYITAIENNGSDELMYDNDAEDCEDILFLFFKDAPPYNRQQELQIKMEHFECSMLVNDLRKNRDQKAFTAAFFTIELHNKPVRLVEFLRDRYEWKKRKDYIVKSKIKA